MSIYKRRRRITKGYLLGISHFHRCPTCGLTRRVLNVRCVGYHGEPPNCEERCSDCEVPLTT